MKTIRISMAICSHLSDAQHLMMGGCLDEANKHINFLKLLMGWLFLKYGLEISVEIPDDYPVTFPNAIIAEDVDNAIGDSFSFEEV